MIVPALCPSSHLCVQLDGSRKDIPRIALSFPRAVKLVHMKINGPKTCGKTFLGFIAEQLGTSMGSIRLARKALRAQKRVA